MAKGINLLAPALAGGSAPAAAEGMNKKMVALCVGLMLLTAAVYGLLYGLNWWDSSRAMKARQELTGQGSHDTVAVNAADLLAERSQSLTNINALKAKKPQLVRYLDELKNAMPVNTFLTDLELKSQPFEMTLIGLSPDQLGISQLAINLQATQYFRDCVISSTKKKVKENMFEFEVTVAPAGKGGFNQ